MGNSEQRRDGDQYYYFGGYADFDTQSGMLQDRVRTSAYYQALVGQPGLFQNKVIMDVGTGTGILALFAARAGAKKIYAIEASPVMARAAQALVDANGFSQVVNIIEGPVESINIPEKVDVIVSEPLGYFLLNEQMIQSYLWAKTHWLKPDGLLFPESARLYAAPVDATRLRQRLDLNCRQWLDMENFFSIDYQPFYSLAKHYDHSRVHVDQILPEEVLAAPSHVAFDFYNTPPNALDVVTLPLPIQLDPAAGTKSLALWFDVTFPADQGMSTTTLSTAPNHKPTHWYQSILLLDEPVRGGETLQLTLKANTVRCYDIDVLSNMTGKLIKTISSSNMKYDYYEHYDEIVQEPSAQFGYELS